MTLIPLTLTGGNTKAVVDGKTDYSSINMPAWWDPFGYLYKAGRAIVRYSSPYPAYNKPVASDGVKWQTFKPTEGW